MQKKIRGLLIFIVAAIIAFSISICSYMFTHNILIGIVFLILDVALLLVPYYYVFFLITDDFNKSETIKHEIANNIKEFQSSSLEKIKSMDGFEEIAESIQTVYDKKVCLEKVNSALNEILVCAATNPKTEEFLDYVMELIMELSKSSMSAFYSTNKLSGKLELKISKGFGNEIYSQFDISISEGFLGRNVIDGKIKVVENIPEDTFFTTKTFLGDVIPKSVMLVPISDEHEVIGVLTLASIYKYTKEQIDILEKIRTYIAYAIKNGSYYEKNERLNNELKFQNQLIQNLNEDLENKIRNRTTFLNATLNSIRDAAIISLDKDNQITLFSKGAEMLFEIKEDDVLGKNILVVSENITTFKDKLDKNLFTVLNKGYSSDIYEVELMAEKKYKLSVEMFSIKDDFDRLEGITVVIRNLSEIAKIEDNAIAEKRLSEVLLSESHRALILADKYGGILKINKNTEYFLGITKNIEGVNISEFFEKTENISKFVDYVTTTKESAELTEKLASGMHITMEFMPICGGDGTISKILIHLH